MNDSSEEKNLPPTEQKLRKVRKKGQVAGSADLVAAMMVIAGIIVTYFSAPSFFHLYNALTTYGISFIYTPSTTIEAELLLFAGKGIMVALAPLIVILIIVIVLANILHKKGIIFSIHPIKPDFNRINPAKGIKRLFSVRNASEFGVSMFRIIIWFAVAIFIIWIGLPDLIASPICGAGCLVASIISIAQWLFIFATILLIAAALIDLPMQVALFRREQRMGVSELKRERKDSYGSPEVKKRRREIALEALSQAGDKVIADSPGILLYGEGKLVEIRYLRGKTPLPIVYEKAEGEAAKRILEQAKIKARPIEIMGEVVVDIHTSVRRGAPILHRHFGHVAAALVKHGLVSK